MSRIDVGGNRAGTQTGYTAYGLTGQERVLIEGINTTEGTGGAGFYFDYASLEEVFLGTTGQSAPRCRTPACRASSSRKSGGNKFQGEYLPRLVQQLAAGHRTCPTTYLVPTAFNNGADPRAQQRDRQLLRPRHQRRRPDQEGQDLVVRHLPQPEERGRRSRTSQFDKTVRHQAVERRRQGHLSDEPEEQADWLLPVGPEDAAEPPAVRDLHLHVARADLQAELGQLGLQGRVERHGQRQAVRRSALRRLRLLLPARSPTARTTSSGTTPARSISRARTRSSSSIATASSTTCAATYFLDTGKGSHTFKIGGELLKEQSWEGYESRRGGTSNIEQVYANGVSTQVIFGIPDRPKRASSLERARRPDCRSAALDRDRARSSTTRGRSAADDEPRRPLRPLQGLAAGAGSSSARRSARVTRGGADVQPKTDLYTWNLVRARASAYVYDLSGDGKTVVKANYGLYWHNPGVGISAERQPEHRQQVGDLHLERSGDCAGCIKGDKRWQPGEEVRAPTAQALAGAIKLDPDIRAPYSHEASVWVERQLSQTMGVRAGFVYKTRGRPDHDQLSAAAWSQRLHRAVSVPGPRLERRPRHGCRRFDGDG